MKVGSNAEKNSIRSFSAVLSAFILLPLFSFGNCVLLGQVLLYMLLNIQIIMGDGDH